MIRNIWSLEFFRLFYIISSQTIHVNQKLHTLNHFATLWAISNLFSVFLYTLYKYEKLTLFLQNEIDV